LSQAPAALKGLYEPIQAEVERVEDQLRAELSHENPFVTQLLVHSTRFQGKRVRPALLLHCAHLLGDARDLHVSLGAVVEMLHTATLVHDDVLDDAALRRQVKTLNAAWGNEASILFGDYLFAKAYTLAAKLHHREANMILAKTVEDMCVGELSQISTKFNVDLDEAAYLKVIHYKTGSLFSASCRLGGVGNAAGPGAVEALARYGSCIGTAFQIVDDCLDITGDEAEMGKSLGTDLEKGKVTLPVIRLLQDLPPRERRPLRELLTSRERSEERRETVARLLREGDSVPWCMKRAADFIDEAKAQLRGFRDSVFTENLTALADFILERRF
jgi:octaprenyl-diphosphate synthase